MSSPEKSGIVEELARLEILLKDGSLTSDEFRNSKSALILRELQAYSPPKKEVERSSSAVAPQLLRVTPPVPSGRKGVVAILSGSAALVFALFILGSQDDSSHQPTVLPPGGQEQIDASYDDVAARDVRVPKPIKVERANPVKAHPASVGVAPGGKVQPNWTATPSFNCSEADKFSEKLICGDPELAAMDVELASLYRRARAASGNSAALQDEQLGWIMNRDECSNRSCLAQSYIERKADVDRWLVDEPH